MEPIRVLLAVSSAVGGYYRDVMAGQPDLEIVGEVTDPVELLLATGRTQADVVILCLQDSELPGICSHLLSEYPHVKILAISPDRRMAFLYELYARRVRIGEVSPEGLLAAIRAAVHIHAV